MASYYAGRDRAVDPGRETVSSAPLFLSSAQQSDFRSTWPARSGSVAFNSEMIALLTLGATMSGSALQAMAQDTIEPQPPKPMTRRERRRLQHEERTRLRAERARDARAQAHDVRDRNDGDDVEVRVYDRYGRQIRTRRVEREVRGDQPRADAPAPLRVFGPFGNW
jgi:hypothetical protein